MMKLIYPAVFEHDPVGYGVYFPDVEGAVTQGETLEEALDNASDVLGIQLAWNIENGLPIPKVTDISKIDYDAQVQFTTLVSVDISDYLEETKPDRKTIYIPHWLNVRAEKEGINFSKTMQEALLKKV
jgi:predicted RNase H-like HicB family nuclease